MWYRAGQSSFSIVTPGKNSINMATEVITDTLPALWTPYSGEDGIPLSPMPSSYPGQPTQASQVDATLGEGGGVTAEDETKYPTGIRFWLIILCNVLVLVFMELDSSIVSTAVPSITDEFHTVADVGWYSSAFRLCACAFAFMFGKIYQLFPLRPIFLTSIAIFMCGSLLRYCTTNLSLNSERTELTMGRSQAPLHRPPLSSLSAAPSVDWERPEPSRDVSICLFILCP